MKHLEGSGIPAAFMRIEKGVLIMKKGRRLVLILLGAALFSAIAMGCSKKTEAASGTAEAAAPKSGGASYHIGIVTGTVSQSEDCAEPKN